MAELTYNEKRLMVVLNAIKKATPEVIAGELNTTAAAVVQFAHLCADKGIASLDRTVTVSYSLTTEGEQYATLGLPERQVYTSFRNETSMKDLQAHPLSRIAIGWMKKKGWVAIEKGQVKKTGDAPEGADEVALRDPAASREGILELVKRGLAEETETTTYTIAITETGKALVEAGLDLREETGTLTREQILSGDWKDLNLRRYSVDKLPKRIVPGKIHPYQRLINEMRSVLLEMGFIEMYGDVVQSSFWNFDALFQPQDHPAREMQDTFYLDSTTPLPENWEAVRDIHEHGGTTSSVGWGGTWMPAKAQTNVLRTHTTGLSIQYLKDHPADPVKAFCIGRVYRREAIDPTHTPEFEQLEGIVMDKDVSFRHLMGFLKEFYGRMGFEDVRFRPAYFPYTEPSVEPEVYVDGLGWVELGGAGIFREEVTDPWGVKYPVLAWGLGVSRVAMLKMGLRDLRQLYRSDVDWIRDTPMMQGGRD
ncbi:phenylalanine--tRNA ligase subunit alpha [Methanogenium sp. MK-MG]|uniref:phenylalanine--tRNA ligase subunit alpha n=1 Tax=Methanogenium sp. MK-MG TaxID=2599926 RepID=UPI0013EB1553|nr:phenylalanine--tRNA ligase subunit alpha [Methanogenium sp. MK-MG]KAF1078519.1 Phenylalanine--tRNA ligase alpha subunit [Methanogenium sp. MK-MG]